MSFQFSDPWMQGSVDSEPTGYALLGQPPPQNLSCGQGQVVSPSWTATGRGYEGPATMERHHTSIQNSPTVIHPGGFWQQIPTENFNATGAANSVPLPGHNNTPPAGVSFMRNGFGEGVEWMSGVNGVNNSQLGSSQSIAQMHPEMHFSAAAIANFRCGWEGCDYRGGFSRKSCLWRHIQDKHVNPDLYQCTYCGKSFGRKDKLMSHTRSVHPQAWSFGSSSR